MKSKKTQYIILRIIALIAVISLCVSSYGIADDNFRIIFWISIFILQTIGIKDSYDFKKLKKLEQELEKEKQKQQQND